MDYASIHLLTQNFSSLNVGAKLLVALEIEIQCPHCHVACKGIDGDLKERNRYQTDLFAIGFIYFVLLLILIVPITYLVMR